MPIKAITVHQQSSHTVGSLPHQPSIADKMEDGKEDANPPNLPEHRRSASFEVENTPSLHRSRTRVRLLDLTQSEPRTPILIRPRSRSLSRTDNPEPYVTAIGGWDDEDEPFMAGNNNAFPQLDTSFNNRSPSPGAGSQLNGNGMNNNIANYMQPLPVGHQQDLNFLYAQIQELSSILQSNREKVNDVTRNAEEVARRANQINGTTEKSEDQDADKARIRELEHELAKSNRIIELYKHEQRENTALIAQYEDALGTATEQIRNYCNDIDGRFLAQRRHYNNLLQAEKDEHLASRLDRDHWHSQTLKVCEMIRTANRLRTDEWCDEYRVIRGLQEEVRCLRRCLGMEAEKHEEETGWCYLKDDPLGQKAGG